MRKPAIRKLLAWVVLAGAVALLATGAAMARKVHEPFDPSFGLQTFRRIGDRQLVEDSTFGGVRREKDRLFSTYDRDRPRGKLACPT